MTESGARLANNALPVSDDEEHAEEESNFDLDMYDDVASDEELALLASKLYHSKPLHPDELKYVARTLKAKLLFRSCSRQESQKDRFDLGLAELRDCLHSMIDAGALTSSKAAAAALFSTFQAAYTFAREQCTEEHSLKLASLLHNLEIACACTSFTKRQKLLVQSMKDGLTSLVDDIEYRRICTSDKKASVLGEDRVSELQTEIAEYLQAVMSTVEDEAPKQALRCFLEQKVRSSLGRQSRIEIFGSSTSLFGLKNCDMDLVLIVPSRRAFHMELEERMAKNREAISECGIALIKSLLKSQKPLVLQEEVILKAQQTKLLGKSYNGNFSLAKATKSIMESCLQSRRRRSYGVKEVEGEIFLLDNMYAAAPEEIQIALSPFLAARREHSRVAAAAVRERKIVFHLRNILEAAGMEDVVPIHGARVPIVKFKDPQSGIDCDLCVNRTLGVHNTALLRTFAQVDRRVRELGYLVKRWAKCRELNDPPTGTLSSYAYIVLIIHFLQRCSPPVLPNLQDEKLILEDERIVDESGYDVSFCRDPARGAKSLKESNQASTVQLLIEFFFYYSHVFNYFTDVIVISSAVDEPAPRKITTWATPKFWRFSVQDPLEKLHDLGGPLKPNGQQAILDEMSRAYALLVEGKPWSEVCEPKFVPSKSSSKKKDGRNRNKARTKKQHGRDNTNNSSGHRLSPPQNTNNRERKFRGTLHGSQVFDTSASDLSQRGQISRVWEGGSMHSHLSKATGNAPNLEAQVEKEAERTTSASQKATNSRERGGGYTRGRSHAPLRGGTIIGGKPAQGGRWATKTQRD